jgi:hypothetical protein
MPLLLMRFSCRFYLCFYSLLKKSQCRFYGKSAAFILLHLYAAFEIDLVQCGAAVWRIAVLRTTTASATTSEAAFPPVLSPPKLSPPTPTSCTALPLMMCAAG